MNKNVRGLVPEALRQIQRSNWPSNVRELRSAWATFPAVSILTTTLEAEEFARKGAVEKIEKVERQVINDVPEITGGNKSKTTRILQIDYKTMHYKPKEYGLNEWKIVIVLWFTQK